MERKQREAHAVPPRLRCGKPRGVGTRCPPWRSRKMLGAEKGHLGCRTPDYSGHTGRLLRVARQRLHSFFSRRTSSSTSVAKSAVATALFGCITMSHPAGISCRRQRTISRSLRRMRLRTTAPPNAFLMLKPKRLRGSPFVRTKTAKCELGKRFPVR